MNVLTSGETNQIVRILSQNNGPHDVLFTPDNVLGSRIAQYGVQSNLDKITGTGVVDYSTDPILPIGSGNFIVLSSTCYSSTSITNILSLLFDQDSNEYEIARVTQRTPVAITNERQLSLFGTPSAPIVSLTFRVHVEAAGAALVLPIGDVRIMWLELT